MSAPWKEMKDEREVEETIRRELPPNAAEADLRAFAAREGFQCSDLHDGAMNCSAPARSDLPLVAAKWLIRFTFDGGVFIGVAVRKGLTGP